MKINTSRNARYGGCLCSSGHLFQIFRGKTRIDPDKIYEINSFKWLNFGKGLIKGFGYFFNFLETLYTYCRNTLETGRDRTCTATAQQLQQDQQNAPAIHRSIYFTGVMLSYIITLQKFINNS